jgi:Na+-transporting methylmalonyl-CoA/oxaloacetate decarboxylase gamma subunit
MTTDLIVGLRLSAIGLSITFLALGLVIVVMDLLMRIFPGGGVAREADESVKDVDEKSREELAVALAVGVSLIEHQGAKIERDPTLGKLLE